MVPIFIGTLSRIIIIFTKLYNSNTHILKFKKINTIKVNAF